MTGVQTCALPIFPYNCKECNKDFFVKPHKLRQHLNRKYKNYFCSYKCSGIFNAKNKTFGSSRSKMEIFLEENLVKNYPSLTFICNSAEFIQAELDFFIPELHIAFEINGIFHYSPIFGEDKLKQTQTKDAFKIEQCKKNNIKLHVLDTSHFRYFKSKNASIFFEKICSIIDGEAKGN